MMRILATAGPTLLVLAALTSAAAAQTVDAGPVVSYLAEIAAAVAMAIVTAALAWLAPFAKRYLDARTVDMAADRIGAAAKRAVAAAREKYAPTSLELPIDLKNQIVADAVGYIVTQVPGWMKTAGMDAAAANRLAERILLDMLGAERNLVTAPALPMDEVRDAVREAVERHSYALGKGGLT